MSLGFPLYRQFSTLPNPGYLCGRHSVPTRGYLDTASLDGSLPSTGFLDGRLFSTATGNLFGLLIAPFCQNLAPG